jgi:dsDNA-specific endonuclease/ATPase MutS2
VDLQKLIERYESQKDENAKRQETDVSKGKKKKTEKFVILNKEKVVDLHIEELLKDHTSMSNSQIISYQLKKFQYEMDQAILNHYYKIIFIHGVGEGILKSAIREELKKYSDIKFSEAPYEKFGHGATEVIFS